NAERCSKISACSGIAVGHTCSAAFLGGYDWPQKFLSAERSEERVDQAAGHQKQVINRFPVQSVENEIGPQLRCLFHCIFAGRMKFGERAVKICGTRLP